MREMTDLAIRKIFPLSLRFQQNSHSKSLKVFPLGARPQLTACNPVVDYRESFSGRLNATAATSKISSVA
jgi:hypothetical protein